MAMPPMTVASCVPTQSPGKHVMSMTEKPPKGQTQSSIKKNPTKHKPIVPIQRIPRFSTGITSVSTAPLQPVASLSLSPTTQDDLRPPRLPMPFLSPILMPGTNLSSFQHMDTSVNDISNTTADSSRWLQIDDLTLLGTDLAALVALDVLRVTFLNGALRVWINRTVHRAWRKQQRRLEARSAAPIGLIFATKSRLIPPLHDFAIRGIPNYGQTCFLNSVLQALASLQPFLTYLERIVQVKHQQPSSQCFSELLWNFLQALQHESLPPIDAREILERVGHYHRQFKSRNAGMVGKEQQDAQELLQALLDIVIGDADLIKGSSLESSILSSNENEEFLSLSAFLMKMDAEQRSSLELSSKTNGIAVVEDGKVLKGGHDTSKKHNGYHDTHTELQLEEKKQEDFEHAGELLQTNGDAAFFPPCCIVDDDTTSDVAIINASERPVLSASTALMLQTLSPVMPSPLSGWLGSTLQCCTCHHVRPIQNAPFLDIPIVPTFVSNYLSGSRGRQPSSQMSCTLAECLAAFTGVERVKDVECRNCTIQRDVSQLEEEVFMLRGAITSLMSRKKGGSEEVEGLQHELTQQESKLAILKNMDPDGCDDIQDLTLSLEDISLGAADEGDRFHTSKALRRGYANKCLLFTRLPNILCLHVQRRYYDPATGQMSKTNQHVDFPEVLDLSPYCAYGGGKEGMPSWAGRGSGSGISGGEISKGKLYRLMSVIEHRGNAFAGHYQTYRRVRSGDAERWVLISDQNITPIRWRDVRSSQAYMLFYESL